MAVTEIDSNMSGCKKNHGQQGAPGNLKENQEMEAQQNPSGVEKYTRFLSLDISKVVTKGWDGEKAIQSGRINIRRKATSGR